MAEDRFVTTEPNAFVLISKAPEKPKKEEPK